MFGSLNSNNQAVIFAFFSQACSQSCIILQRKVPGVPDITDLLKWSI